MVQGAVTDFFRQTVIDYVQGSLSLSGLERYNDQLAAQDPSESFRLARVRANAIESCASMVLGEDEEKLGGWTLFSPVEAGKVHSAKFEEKVVLLVSRQQRLIPSTLFNLRLCHRRPRRSTLAATTLPRKSCLNSARFCWAMSWESKRVSTSSRRTKHTTRKTTGAWSSLS